MSKLSEKLRYFKFIRRMKNKEISEFTGATEQAVKNWQHEDRCPKQLKRQFAVKLVEFCKGEITLSDCGYAENNTMEGH